VCVCVCVRVCACGWILKRIEIDNKYNQPTKYIKLKLLLIRERKNAGREINVKDLLAAWL
jgi:hypothetical protein